MALRDIVKEGDKTLSKRCRRVEKFDEKLALLLDDMIQTLKSADGVGLAAPQVGILKRVCIVDRACKPRNCIICRQAGGRRGLSFVSG